MTDCADKLGTYILFSYCGVLNGARGDEGLEESTIYHNIYLLCCHMIMM